MKRKLLIVLLILATITLAGCGGGGGESGGDKTLILGSTNYFSNEGWDPTVGWDAMYIQSFGVAETLFRLDDHYTAMPWLAKEIENKDDLTWEITLREDVQFHNGDAMTAEAIKKCFERTLEKNERAKAAIPVDSIEANGQTLTIVTKEPLPTMKNDLADPLWVVYNTENTEDFDKQTYYTGPFVPTEFEQSVAFTVEKFDDYWGEQPKVDRAIFKTLKDEESLVMALQSGDIDLLIPLRSSAYPTIKDNEKIEMDKANSTRAQFMQLNMESPVLSDKAVRQAIAMCVDRKSYAEVITHGRDDEAYVPFPEVLPFGGTQGMQLEVDKMDVEGAKKLLEAAGYKDSNGNGILDQDGTELTMRVITYSTYSSQLQLYELLQKTLKDIGIDLVIMPVESPNDYYKTGNFEIRGASYITSPTGSANYFTTMMFDSKGANNFGHYQNEEVDRLTEELARTFDEGKRDEITRKIVAEVVNDFGYIFFANEQFTAAYNKDKVKTYHTHPSELYILDSTVEMH